MSATIDERVVQMRFDNAQFEQNAKHTLSTLDKLKNALRLSDSANSMNDAAKNLGGNFNLLSSSADAVARRFSALEIVGVTALVNIANSAVNAGKQLIKSLTVDPISQGFGEYELKMGSVQTIMASTGESIDVVNGYLEELNRYSDKTIYSFSDMTSNIGKFTNAGVKLEDAVLAIKGISNEAAVSGANAQEASRAMYNFSQALSAGYVKLIDWKSIENANMATVEFKNQLIQTAVAMGTLEEKEGMYVSTTKDMNGKVSAAFDATRNFNDSLSAQWMTSEVLVRTLGNYATDIRDMSKEEKKAYEEKLKSIGYTEEQIKKIEELGQKAFDSAQDVKTFSQLMDTLKEAAGSGWAQTFEILFGNLEEAKVLWTDVSKVVGGFIDQMSDARNTMLKEWKDLGGRATGIEALKNVFHALLSVAKPVSDAFREIFPRASGERLFQLTEKFRDFTKNLAISEEATKKVHETFKRVFGGFKGLFSIVEGAGRAVVAVIKPIRGALANAFPDNFGKNFLKAATNIQTVMRNLVGVLESDGFSNALETFYTVVFRVFTTAAQIIGAFARVVTGGLRGVSGIVSEASEAILNFFSSFKMGSKFEFKLPEIKFEGGGSLANFTDFLFTIATTLGKAFAAVGSAVAAGVSAMGFDSLQGVVNAGLLTTIMVGIKKFVDMLNDSSSSIGDFIKKIKDSGGIGKALETLSDAFKEWQTSVKAASIMKIAAAIGILALSLIALSGVDSDKMANALVGIGGLFAELVTAVIVLNNFGGPKGFVGLTKTATGLLVLSVAVSVLAGAIRKLSDLDMGQIGRGLIAIAAMLAMMVGVSKYMDKRARQLKKVAASMILFAVAVRILASSVNALSSLNLGQLGTGLLGIAAIMAIIAGFSRILNSSGLNVRSGVAMIAIAASLVVLSSAVEKFSGMKWGDLAKGAAILTVFLGVVAGFSRLAASSGKLLAFAVSLTIISGAMSVLTNAVAKLADLSWEDLGKGGAAIAAFVGILALASLLKSTKLLAASAAMLIFSVATIALASAMTIMAKLDWKGVAVGLAAIAGTFLILGVAAAVLAPVATVMALLGVAVLALGAGIFALVSAVAALVAGGTALAGGLTLILTAIAGTIPLFITQLVSGIGQGMVALLDVIIQAAPKIGEAGIVLIATLCSAVLTCTPMIATTLFQLIVVALVTLANGIETIVSALMSLIVNGINALANSVRTNSEAIMAAVRNLLSSIIELAIEAIASLLELIPGVGGKLADGVRGAKEKVQSVLAPESMASTAKQAASGVASGIQEGTGEVESASSLLGDAALSGLKPDELISKFQSQGDFGSMLSEELLGSTDSVQSASAELSSSASEGIKQSTEKIKEEGKSAGEGYATKLGNAKDKVKKSAQTLGTNAKNGVKGIDSSMKTSGQNAGEGLARGIESKSGRVYQAAYSTARQAVLAVNAALQEKSPSRILFQSGAYGSIGLANGFTAYGDVVSKSATSVAEGAIDAMSLSLAKVSDAVDSNTDFSPTLTPVIDLSKATSAYSDISSLFNTDKTVTLMSSISGQMDANNVVLDYISKLDAANASRNTSILDKFDKLSEDILTLGERIENLELTLDGDKLVGGIAKRADRALGTRAILDKRGL